MKTLRERLLSRAAINMETGCWEWTGHVGRGGYATIRLGGRDAKTAGVHRVSYELYYGPIPEGLQLDHLCRVRHCLNPAHLEPVTPRVNVLRGETLPAVNVAKTHCANGHEFTPENTRIEAGARLCVTCRRKTNRETMRRAYARQRARHADGSASLTYDPQAAPAPEPE